MTTPGRFKFSSLIRHDDLVVRDHQVHGARTLPGVTYLDLLYRYLQGKGVDTRELTVQLLFKQALVVDEGADQKLVMTLDPFERGWRVQGESVRVRDGRTLDTAVIDHFRGEIRREARRISPERLDIGALKERAVRVSEIEEIYSRFRSLGLCHYDGMKLRGRGYHGADYVLAEVHLSPLAKEHRDHFFLHPAMLDGASFIPGTLLVGGSFTPENVYLPLYLDSFSAWQKIQDPCYLYVREGDATMAPSQDITNVDIRIYNGDGSLAASFQKLAAKRVRAGAFTERQGVEVRPPADRQEGASPSEPSIRNDLKRAIANLLGAEEQEIETDRDFYTLGLNSRQLMDLVSVLEQKLGTTLYPTLLFEHNNIEDLARYLASEYGLEPQGASAHPSLPALPVPEEDPREVIERDLRALVGGILGRRPEEVDVEADYYSQGLDSGHLLRLVEDLETRLGQNLYPTLLFEYPSIRKLAEFLAEQSGTRTGNQEAAAAVQAIHDPGPAPEVRENAGFYYLPRWVRKPLDRPEMQVSVTGPRLIIYPEAATPLKMALARALGSTDLLEIRLGAESRELSAGCREVRSDDPTALARCLETLPEVEAICFLGIAEPLSAVDPADLDRTQEEGVLSLFRLVKALRASRRLRNLRELKVITNNTAQVDPGDEVVPWSASLLGFVKSLQKEYPRVAISCVDIDMQEVGNEVTEGMIVRSILTEPAHKQGEEVAIRRGARFERSFVPVTLGPVSHPPFQVNGVYLIVGGAGGIGLELGLHLAKTVQANLVLVGRRALGPPEQAKVAAIEAAGGKVLYLQADATDLPSMAEAVQRAKAAFGRINGVIHSAIVLKDRLVESMTEADLVSAMAPKVKGSLVLFKAVEKEPLDFFLFFSSVQSFIGNVGQSNYAAACTFKDALAAHLRRQAAYPVQTINWGYWGSVGVAASREYNEQMRAGGMGSIEPAEGMAAMELALHHRLDQIIPVKLDPRLMDALGVNRQRAIHLEPPTLTPELATVESSTLDNGGLAIVGMADAVTDASFDDYWRSQTAKGRKQRLTPLDVSRPYFLLASKLKQTIFHLLVEPEPGEVLEAVVAGSGRPILLINGFGTTAIQWHNQLVPLSRHHQAIVLHAPGHGYSVGSSDMTMAGIARSYVKALEQLAVDWPVHVVGSSWGGMIAQTLAREFPERVASLTLAGSMSHTGTRTSADLKESILADLENIGAMEHRDVVLGSTFVNADLRKYRSDDFSTESILSEIITPTLVITGERDTVVGTEEAMRLSARIPGARYCEIDGAGHLPYLTHAGEFNHLVMSFIQEQEAQIAARGGQRSQL